MSPAVPRFINPQPGLVGVYVNGRKVYIGPFEDVGTRLEKKDILYVLEGAEFSEQCAPKGPLAPFPGTADAEAKLAAFLGKPAPAAVAPVAPAAPVRDLDPARAGALAATGSGVAGGDPAITRPSLAAITPAITEAPESQEVKEPVTGPESGGPIKAPAPAALKSQPRRAGPAT